MAGALSTEIKMRLRQALLPVPIPRSARKLSALPDLMGRFQGPLHVGGKCLGKGKGNGRK